jgi:uridine kinase
MCESEQAIYDDDERGPLLVAPPPYLELRRLLRKALNFPSRRPLLIGIDGLDGSGKSSAAAWLSWQLEMPAVNLDVYVVQDSKPLVWRFDDLARTITGAQSGSRRPVIVEGIMLLHVLRHIDRRPDFHVFIEKEGNDSAMKQHLESYLSSYQPKSKANYVLRWSSAAHDARVRRAHIEMLRNR